MPDTLFPVLGTKTAPMLGRADVMRRLWDDLTKRTPSHLQVVGPRYSGKTVLLRTLEQRMSETESPYSAVIYWDLGHQTPQSDEAFLVELCRRIGQGLREKRPDDSKYLLALESDHYSDLSEVLDALSDEQQKLLMLWDGFDRPLASGRLTRNLWDQLRELASKPSLRLVTASRQTLRELIRSEESAASDFWNVFDMTPVRVGVFNEDDREAIFKQIPHIDFKESARKELENWTAGYPPLFLCVINRISFLEVDVATNETVNSAATHTLEELNPILDDLWKDCPETAKSIYRRLISHGPITTSSVGRQDIELLRSMGLTTPSGNQLRSACRLLERYIDGLGEDAGSLVRLFEDYDSYQSNIRSVLEHRLKQVTGIDQMLHRYINKAIEDIPDYPEVCLQNIRGIIDCALELIWNVELGSDKEIPSEWFDYWSKRERGGVDMFARTFPKKRGYQIRLLQLMTGTQDSVAKATKVTKNTYALANALQGFGDYGQHLEGTTVPTGVAVAAVTMCIELAACLTEELVR